MNRRIVGRGAALVAFLLVALGAALWFKRDKPMTAPRAALSPAAILGKQGDDRGFERAMQPRDFQFPTDHGPHPSFRSEWWYFTGVLDAAGGRLFGYELTFFRFALAPEPADRASAWSANQVYMAHFALTDAAAGRFHAFEKTSRAALAMAGAAAAPFHVWVLDWSAEGPARADEATPVRLRARSGEVAIDLELAQGKPPVLEGERGLSRKGRAPGNASYYYSLTRMPTRGTILAGGRSFDVKGDSWMDREWGTSALEPEQVGWDWLGLALADGREVMLYRLRRRDGSIGELRSGTLVEKDGRARRLAAGDAALRVLGTWQSPKSGVTYPSTMQLEVPSAGLDLVLEPVLRDQELDLSFRYWEGAVLAKSGTRAAGRGYLELTGYGPVEPR